MSKIEMTLGDYVELDRMMRDYRKEKAILTSGTADDAEIQMAQDTLDYLGRAIPHLLAHSTKLGKGRQA